MKINPEPSLNIDKELREPEPNEPDEGEPEIPDYEMPAPIQGIKNHFEIQDEVLKFKVSLSSCEESMEMLIGYADTAIKELLGKRREKGKDKEVRDVIGCG